MFRVRVYINDEIIEDIEAINLGIDSRRVNSRVDERQYDVSTSKEYFQLYHNRRDGWEELLTKILNKIKEKEIDE